MLNSDNDLSLGPLIVVCPTFAVMGPRRKLELQALAFSNWPSDVFLIGSLFCDLNLNAFQREYLRELKSAVTKRAVLHYSCDPTVSGVEAGVQECLQGAGVFLPLVQTTEWCRSPGRSPRRMFGEAWSDYNFTG